MINSVRNTVLATLQKNNFGYISPSDFNLFAKQAQIEIFKDLMEGVRRAVNRENRGLSGVDYADNKKRFEDTLNALSRSDILTNVSTNIYSMPTLVTTGFNAYLINSMDVLDGAGNFLAKAEEVSQSRISTLNALRSTAPSILFPVYTTEGTQSKFYPDTISGANRVRAQYVRYPKDPKWTYITMAGGEPIFDQSQPDFQDFELPGENESALVIKILEYAGISIREQQVYQFAKVEERDNNIADTPQMNQQ